MKKDIIGFNKEKIGEITLNEALVSEKVSEGSLYYKLINENANIHPGNVFKKNRMLVSGGGKKPYRQKGTGRARQGSIRAPHYRKGGQVWGNQRKVYSFKLPDKIKQTAIIALFNIKFKQNLITIIDDIKLNTPRIKEISKLMKSLINIEKEKVNLIILEKDKNIKQAVGNIENVRIVVLKTMRVIDLLNNNPIFITQSAMKYLNGIKG